MYQNNYFFNLSGHNYNIVTGFGMSTPRTVAGRVVSIMYGLVGCSGFILFFNLFLERVITLTTCVMRGANACWQRRRRRGSLSVGWAPQQNDVASVESAAAVPDSDSRSSHSQSDGRGGSGGCDDTWKPSVYLVMLVLFLAVLVIGCLSSLLYSWAEQWTFGEAIYFSFCLFATIGFGDFVPLQRSTYAYINTYRVCNALIFVVGCSCMYSLFNVVSIVIKQILNACIYWMEAGCKRMMLSIARLSSGRHRSKIRALQRLGRRNVIGPLTNTSGQGHRHSDSSAYANRPNRVNRSIRHKSADGIVSATSNNNTQRGQERGSDIKVDEGLEVVQQQQQQQQRTPQRSRDQTISVSDSSEEWELNVQQLIKHNQVNLAILQKQLHDTTNAHRRRAHHVIDSHATTNHAHAISISDNSGLKEGVGPLAMLNTKFNGKDSGV